jgi:hypothetical protein
MECRCGRKEAAALLTTEELSQFRGLLGIRNVEGRLGISYWPG